MRGFKGKMAKLSFNDARHLVARTGIGVEWKTIKRYQNLTKQQAINELLKSRPDKTPPPPRMTEWRKTQSLRSNMRRKKMIKRISRNEGKALQEWWVKHLEATRSPFVERMTLFWHNHFPSSIKKTQQVSMLHQQNLLLRKHALGNFKTLLNDIAKDPAMLVYLDGYVSTKDDPNENFARELLELFTLGIGHYTENDMREASRAFTGWGIDDRSGRFRYRADEHDNGIKTFLRQRGNLRGEDILNILITHPRTAITIAEKMWHEFINIDKPNTHVINQWSHIFRKSNYEITALLRAVLSSKEFWAASNRGALIKSPIELTIGTLRALPYSVKRNNLAHNLNIMGQAVFAHASVKGWEGGRSWISTQSLLRRNSMMTNLTAGNLNEHKYNSGLKMMLPDIPPKQLEEWLLAIPHLQTPPTKPGKLRLTRAFVLDPAYQVN